MLAFGADASLRPAGRRADGARSSRSRATTSCDFHAARWKPGSSRARSSSATITLADATALATKHFGAWTGGAAAAVSMPAAAAGARREALHRGPPGCGADGRRAVPAGAEADVAGLRRADAGRRGVGRRRLRHAPEPQPARGQGLLATACSRTSVPMREAGVWFAGRRRADGQDQRIGGRVRQGDEEPRRRRSRSPRTSSPSRSRPRSRGFAQRVRVARAGQRPRSRTCGASGCR